MEENMEVNIEELEKQRYDFIKETGKYLELNVLIRRDSDEHDGRSTKLPVITIDMHSCGGEEIGCLYMTLQNIAESLRQDYPLDCMIASKIMQISRIKTSEIKKDYKKDKEEE